MKALVARPRQDLRKSENRRLRLSGHIPAVVYGKKIKNTPISIDGREFMQVVRSEGSNAVIQLSWDGLQSSVMIGEVQQDFIKNDIVHIDFYEVNMNEQIKVEIPVEWIGEPEGILQKQYHTIEVSCLPSSIPESISIDVSQLQIGDSYTVAQLRLPEGVEAQLPPESVIVSVTAANVEEEAEDATEATGEPEAVDESPSEAE